MTTSSRLARYVTPNLSEDRVMTQWAGSLAVAKLRSREQKAGLVLGLAALCLAAALVVLSWRPRTEVQSVAGAVVESGPSEPQRLTFPDGTRVELAAATRLSVVEAAARRVRLRVEHGGVTLDVTPNPERELVVEAGRTEVVVVGTRFRVVVGDAAGEPQVTVAVERGAVRVRSLDGGAETQLAAGQSWIDPHPVATASRGAGPALGTTPSAEPTPSAAPPPESSAGSSPESPVSPSAGPERSREQDPKAAFAALGTEGFARAVASASASRLFELYEIAQLAGRPAEAATALDQLRRRFPGDSRAGLAAFELGRLRQDQLGDPAGAAEALENALRRGGAFGEDASARLVQAYRALGNRAGCERARANYLAKYPSGAHAEAVRRQCRR
ncbi:MAG: FecR domain-containing protein [Polyangiaceae bacterium]|nr:FecR domain-containing protein [Polyangiaceae bacterium]